MEQNCVWLFYYFYFERNCDVLKSKSSYILLNRNINFKKIETESKWKIPHTVLGIWTMCFSSYKNCKLKVKLWWIRALKRKKSSFFIRFILSEGKFFNIYVLSPCIVYWRKFQDIYTFTYKKKILHTLLLLVFKTVESLQCILKV